MTQNQPYATDHPWFNFWVEHPIIAIDSVFGPGGEQNLRTASGFATLALTPRTGNQGELVGFKIQVIGSSLKRAWDGITLAPLGTEPCPDMEAAMSDGEPCQWQRLEGYLPVTDETNGNFNIDRVRIIRIAGPIAGVGDRALIRLHLIDQQPILQDGGGSGPPKRVQQ